MARGSSLSLSLSFGIMKNAPCNTIRFLPRQRKRRIHDGGGPRRLRSEDELVLLICLTKRQIAFS